MFLIGGSHFQRFLGGLYVILNIVSPAGQLLTAMAFGSNSSLVLAESSPIAKSRLTLSNVSTVYQTAPVVSYSTPVLQHLASSNLLLQRKTSFKENDNRVGAMRAAHLVDDLSLASHFHREELCLDVADASYSSWMADHPSALSLFDHMIAAAKGKHIAVFLDYDGTLSPIVEDPEKAFMSDAMRSTVQDVAKFFPTAIISGRSRDKVFDFVQLSEIYYAGSHGMDIMAPAKASSFVRHAYTRARDQKNNEVILFQPASEFLPMINEVFKLLQEKTKQIHGARVENNKFCVTVHFRCVEEMNWSALAEIVRNVLTQFPRLQLNLGKKILEIKPSIQWHKGNALEFLLQALGLANSTDVIPLYIGDDSTDEDAFKVLQTRGQGYSILVSSVPKETSASYSLRDPTEVMGFLRRLVKWKKNCSTNR